MRPPTGATPVALRAPSVTPVEKHTEGKKQLNRIELNYTEKLSDTPGPP
jgi:hypothetical protein